MASPVSPTLSHQPPHPPQSLYNKLGYYPVSGQVVAVWRGLYGVVKAVACLALAILSTLFTGSPGRFAGDTVDGLKHIGRACVEMVPVLGGVATYWYDGEPRETFVNVDAL